MARLSHDEQGIRLTPQLLLGLFVAAAGVLLTLDNLGIVEADRYLRFWPIGLVALGLFKLSQAHRRHSASFGATRQARRGEGRPWDDEGFEPEG